ncbi:MAG: ABC transporter permease [Spirochaetales bacterium]|nr:ABC transporter permease [Spirochaetales bacterium]
MKAFIHHLAYDFKTGIRDRTKLLMFYLFPLAFFFAVSSFMTQINPFFKDTMIPAMVLFAVMSACLLSLPGTLVTARESGVFRSFRINGVPAASILSIPVISAAAHMAVAAVIIGFAGTLVFKGAAPANVLGFAAAALLSYLAYAGFGLVLGTAAGNANASILLAQAVYIPSILLGGLMVPLSVLPDAFRRAALILPSSHGMILFQALGYPAAGKAFPWVSLAALGGGAVVSFFLSAWIFQWDTRASRPNRKAFAALLALVPYALAVAVGG